MALWMTQSANKFLPSFNLQRLKAALLASCPGRTNWYMCQTLLSSPAEMQSVNYGWPTLAS
jgi:hypothetical protein